MTKSMIFVLTLLAASFSALAASTATTPTGRNCKFNGQTIEVVLANGQTIEVAQVGEPVVGGPVCGKKAAYFQTAFGLKRIAFGGQTQAIELPGKVAQMCATKDSLAAILETGQVFRFDEANGVIPVGMASENALLACGDSAVSLASEGHQVTTLKDGEIVPQVVSLSPGQQVGRYVVAETGITSVFPGPTVTLVTAEVLGGRTVVIQLDGVSPPVAITNLRPFGTILARSGNLPILVKEIGGRYFFVGPDLN